PGGKAAAALPAPSSTSRTAAPFGSMVIRIALPSAASAGAAKGWPPCRCSASRAAAERSLPRTANPASTRRRGIARPIRPSPPRGSGAAPRAGGPSVKPHLLQHLACDAEAVEGGRHAAIDGDLQEDLAQLVLGHAVVDRAAHMQAQLMRPVEGGDHSEIEDA